MTINTIADSYTLTTGTEASNTFTETHYINGIKHEHTDDGGVMELYYEFDVGSGTSSSVKLSGLLNGTNDLLGVYAYDWDAAVWVQIGFLEGKVNTTINEVFIYDLFPAMSGTGANQGIVRIRFFAGSGLTSATLRIDQIFATHTLEPSISTQITALNDISVSDILTTQMTESYAQSGDDSTVAQALYLIQQTIGDFSISGTTLTTKKVDGTTIAATYTLDDDTAPTSRSRNHH